LRAGSAARHAPSVSKAEQRRIALPRFRTVDDFRRMRAGRQSVGQRQRLAAGVQAYPAFLAVDHNVEIGLVAAGLRHGPQPRAVEVQEEADAG
jgi:hypothetical protein